MVRRNTTGPDRFRRAKTHVSCDEQSATRPVGDALPRICVRCPPRQSGASKQDHPLHILSSGALPAPYRFDMKNVLSIQSHVVFGHAGNSASVFPMRRLGVNVWPLNTVQFSNHTQYGHWEGSAIDASQMLALVEGIGAIGVLPRCDAVLSGYLGTPEQAQSVIEIVRAVKAANPHARYFCDPVMGTTTGCRVEPGIQEFLVRTMPEVSDVMCPNHSELQRLV